MVEVAVASINLHAGLDGWGRPFDVAHLCKSLDADVLVLQEDWFPDESPSASERLAESTGYSIRSVRLAKGYVFGPPPFAMRGWGPRPGSSRVAPSLRLDSDKLRGPAARWPASRFAERGAWGLSILSRLPVVGAETIELGKLKHDPARRAALVLRLETPSGEVTVVGTHLSHFTHGSLRQLARLRASLPSAGAEGVLAGDMNLWGPPVSALLPGWRRAVRGRTWPSSRPLAQLDHILVTKSVRVIEGRVVALHGSDHLPVRVRLSVGS